jgi:uncharacterized protein
MFIDLNNFNKNYSTTKRLSFTVKLPSFSYNDETISFPVPIQLQLDVSYNKNEIIIKGEVPIRVKRNCHRCLEPFVMEMKVPILEKLIEQGENDYHFDGDEDGEMLSAITNNVLNLLPIIKQAIYLVLPMKAVCRDSCAGLCAQCGCNLNYLSCNCKEDNLDPRLSVLQNLLEK